MMPAEPEVENVKQIAVDLTVLDAEEEDVQAPCLVEVHGE